MSTSKKVIQQTMDEMTGLIENSALDTLVAWVRDLLDRVTVDGREEHAVTIWRTATDDGVNRSDSVSSWLRRAGAGHLLRFRGETASEFPLPRPVRSREWMKVALVECARCHQVTERTSPVQRHCADCATALGRERSRESVRRRRDNSRQP
jgi:hypothetical protein